MREVLAGIAVPYPLEPGCGHSVAEETGALTVAASMTTKSSDNASTKATDPDLALFQSLIEANMLEPHVLLNGAVQGIAKNCAGYWEAQRAKLEKYLNRFVAPPAPVKP